MLCIYTDCSIKWDCVCLQTMKHFQTFQFAELEQQQQKKTYFTPRLKMTTLKHTQVQKWFSLFFFFYSFILKLDLSNFSLFSYFFKGPFPYCFFFFFFLQLTQMETYQSLTS